MPHPRITGIFTVLLVLGLLAPLVHTPDRSVQADTEIAFVFEAVDLSNGADFALTRAREIDLTAYPIVPPSAGQGRAIAQQGQQLDRDLHMFSKVGDCHSTEWLFMYPFGEEQYDLGPYNELQGVINYFTDAFALQTYAAYNGLNVFTVLDPVWADPTTCEPGETPLACEYRLHNPGVAVIMFGTNDMFALTGEQFDHYLRRVVLDTMNAGVIPLLSTFPRHLGFPERSILFNQIVVRVALDYNLPLINLWLALEPLPNHGIDDDEFHLNGPLTRAADLSNEANLRTGYPMRNLVTLQALDVIMRDALSE